MKLTCESRIECKASMGIAILKNNIASRFGSVSLIKGMHNQMDLNMEQRRCKSVLSKLTKATIWSEIIIQIASAAATKKSAKRIKKNENYPENCP